MTPVRRTSKRIQNKPPDMVHATDPERGGKVIKKSSSRVKAEAPVKKEISVKNELAKLKEEGVSAATTASSSCTSAFTSPSLFSTPKGTSEIQSRNNNRYHNLRKKKENKSPSPISAPVPVPAAPAPLVKTKIRKGSKSAKQEEVSVPKKQKQEDKTIEKRVENETEEDEKKEKTEKQILITPKSQFLRPALIDKDQVPKEDAYVKTRVVAQKTPSFKETFTGRLDWKQRHYDKPITSTPVPPKIHSATTLSQERDSCFGFDDSGEGSEDFYKTLISPIHDPTKARRKEDAILYRNQAPVTATETKPVDPAPAHVVDYREQFENLLYRYHDDEDGGLHVNPEGAKITYSSKTKGAKSHMHDFHQKLDKSLKPKSKSTKKRKVPDGHKKEHKAGKADLELEKWVEEKNKEFQDIDKVKLVFESSHSP